MPLTNKGKERLEEVKELISAAPNRIQMGRWIDEQEANECGTAACIAGWLVINEELKREGKKATPKAIKRVGLRLIKREERAKTLAESIRGRARRLLGLSWDETRLLFYETGWPSELTHDYYWGGRVRATCSAIDHFIQHSLRR